MFEVRPAGGEHIVPLSALLQPGDYALIFGTGGFGAYGWATMPNRHADTSQASFFWGSPRADNYIAWANSSGHHNLRFLVNGTVVPEPSTLLLTALGMPLLLRRRR